MKVFTLNDEKYHGDDETVNLLRELTRDVREGRALDSSAVIAVVSAGLASGRLVKGEPHPKWRKTGLHPAPEGHRGLTDAERVKLAVLDPDGKLHVGPDELVGCPAHPGSCYVLRRYWPVGSTIASAENDLVQDCPKCLERFAGFEL